jgi:hypothetical protein
VYSLHLALDVAPAPFGRARVLTVRPMLAAVNRCEFGVW